MKICNAMLLSSNESTHNFEMHSQFNVKFKINSLNFDCVYNWSFKIKQLIRMLQKSNRNIEMHD